MIYISSYGVSLYSISQTAERMGFHTLKMKLTLESLIKYNPCPCILFVDNNHYVVLYKIKKSKLSGKTSFCISDPAFGNITLNIDNFSTLWLTHQDNMGVALILSHEDEVHHQTEGKAKTGFTAILAKYYLPFKKYYALILLGLFALSCITFVLPFLFKSIVDIGIASRSLRIIFLIFCAQIVLLFAQQGLNIIRSWLLLHINIQISIRIISDFLTKLMRIPVKFYLGKSEGDFMQRIQDHAVVEGMLTKGLLDVVFSFVTMTVFSIVLIMYHVSFFVIFLAGSTLSFLWIALFTEKRKKINYIRFKRSRECQNNVFEILHGIEEIKINNDDLAKKWQWQRSQLKLFDLNVKSLKLEQIQSIGNFTISQIKDMCILFLAAKDVITDSSTLGTMISISFIIGLLNSPIEQLVSFFRSFQDAKLSMERLLEVNDLKDEEETSSEKKLCPSGLDKKDIVLNHLSFSYEGVTSSLVLKDLNMTFKAGKVTAIVGASGCGKTTLMKLLLRYYTPLAGEISLSTIPLNDISIHFWRDQVGSVLQEGFLFSDSIENNIILKNESNSQRLEYALQVSNSLEFIKRLPFGVHTKIGKDGLTLSAGQKQRLLIARAIYKDPKILIFDEATSSLDAKNEYEISEQLQSFFHERTTIIIAHRLSTVKKAHKIVVIGDGKVIESGTHDSLLLNKGAYYHLINKQLA